MSLALVPDEYLVPRTANDTTGVPEDRNIVTDLARPFQPGKKPGLWKRLFAKKAPRKAARAARAYQERLITSVIDAFEHHKTVLLAACPNAGKTFMAGEIIGRLVAAGRVQRVLVLAHGTKVLRRQFLADLEEHRPDLLAFIDVRIPQGIHRKQIEKYDLVIVDEAHQFYGKGERGDGKSQKMMSTILGKASPKNVLLLTGSPAKFIADGKKAGEDMFCFSLEQLHNEQADAVADVMIECASSHYKITEDDYADTFDDVRRDFDGYTQAATAKTLDDVLEGLLTRLKLSGDRLDGVVGRARYASTKAGWNYVLGRMEKTILAVPSIKVAKQAGAYLTKKGVSCLVSHSEDDVESEHIKSFKTDDSIRLLIVVNRAQLGFDHRELFHFIDMTGSKSPDRIFQMFCRVVRSSIENPRRNKLFVKVMPRIFSEIQIRTFMSGVLSLAQQANFEKWNGKGLSLLDVPVAREREPRCPDRKKHEAGVKCEKCGFVKCSLLHVIDVQCTECGKTKTQMAPLLESGMLAFGDYFKALEHNPDDPFCPYAMAKLGAVLGMKLDDPTYHKDEIVRFFHSNGRWPRAGASDSREHRLGSLLSNYTAEGGVRFDPGFVARLRALGWLHISDRTAIRKRRLIEWYRTNRRPPNQRSKIAEEAESGGFLSQYAMPRSKMYDPEVEQALRQLGWLAPKERINEKKRRCVEFILQRQARPSQHSADPVEKSLAGVLTTYTDPNRPSYDPAFVAQINAAGVTTLKQRGATARTFLLSWYLNKRDVPKQTSVDPTVYDGKTESMWGTSCQQLIRTDPTFTQQMRANGWKPISERVAGGKEFLVEWVRTHDGYRPRKGSEDQTVYGDRTEHQWNAMFNNWIRVDPKFRRAVKAAGLKNGNKDEAKGKRIAQKKFKPIVHVGSGALFPSISAAAAHYGANNISAVLAGRLKHTGGHVFRWATPEERAMLDPPQRFDDKADAA